MKLFSKSARALFFPFLLVLSLSAANRPGFQPGQIWPDDQGVHINAHGGGVLFHEGTYYWFGERKAATADGAVAEGVSVYSSPDLYHWTNLGLALPLSGDPASDLVRGCTLERPKVIFNARTGKFVMWFHLELKGQGYHAARSGVAVADKITGPYRYCGSFRPNAGFWPQNLPPAARHPLTGAESAALAARAFTGGSVPDFPADLICRRDFGAGQMARDMTLFVDDDGHAYHVYSSEENGTLHISRLSDDYLRPAGEYVRILPGRFNEAPALFKHDGRYYLISSGCTGWAPNAARSAVADAIFGPWKELCNPCVGSPEATAVTFNSQATFVVPVHGRNGTLIFMADRWNAADQLDSRHLWLPIRFVEGRPIIAWQERWSLD